MKPREEFAVRMIAMNRAMLDLRDEIDAAAELAKEVGATDLAFATYHLSESIAVYATALNSYMVRELRDFDGDATL